MKCELHWVELFLKPEGQKVMEDRSGEQSIQEGSRGTPRLELALASLQEGKNLGWGFGEKGDSGQLRPSTQLGVGLGGCCAPG